MCDIVLYKYTLIDGYLSSLLCQVRLLLETLAPTDDSRTEDTSSVRKTKASPPASQLVRLLWGEDTAELQMSIAHVPHIVMFLSLKLDSASPQEEVSVCVKCIIKTFMHL